MFKKLFGKKEKNNELIIKSPVKGRLVELENVADEAFSKKMLGDGIAIEPSEGIVYSPVDGEVVQIFLP